MEKIVIVQARLGSSRLPGKVLKQIGPWTPIILIFERLQKVFPRENIVFAIPDDMSNDSLEKALKDLGASYVRGSEDDVYSRFLKVLANFPCETFVRITADCPLISPNILKDAIKIYDKGGYDIVHNSPMIAEGLDFEIVKSVPFTDLAKQKMDPLHTQHPTLKFYENRTDYRIFDFEYDNIDDSKFRITLDEPEDLLLLRKLFERFDSALIDTEWNEIKTFLEENPAIFGLNNRIIRNEGLQIDKEKNS